MNAPAVKEWWAVEWEWGTGSVSVRRVMDVLEDGWTRMKEGRPGQRVVLALLAHAVDAEAYASGARRELKKRGQTTDHRQQTEDHGEDGEERRGEHEGPALAGLRRGKSEGSEEERAGAKGSGGSEEERGRGRGRGREEGMGSDGD